MTRRLFFTLALAILLIATGAESQPAPRRIISVSPNVTEILEGLGVFGRVIAVSEYCHWPEGVKNLPRVGGWHTPNLETIVSLSPDLVILTDAQAPFIQANLAQLNIRMLVVPSQTVSDTFRAIKEIGRAVGSEAQAQQLIGRTRAALDNVRTRTRSLPQRTVLCVVDRTPGTLRDVYAATEGSFLSELIRIAGGRAIAPPGRAGYTKISKEAIVTLDPEVIIDMVQGAKGRLGENPIAVWRDLPGLRAVQKGRIYPMRAESVLHASQFIADTAKLFAELIHPEVFSKSAGSEHR